MIKLLIKKDLLKTVLMKLPDKLKTKKEIELTQSELKRDKKNTIVVTVKVNSEILSKKLNQVIFKIQ